jgi:hypothetical protein
VMWLDLCAAERDISRYSRHSRVQARPTAGKVYANWAAPF